MPVLTYAHIELRDDVPYIEGTRTKVVMIVLEHVANHWDAEAIRRQHPTLSLAHIHSALAYYYDHQVEVDATIESRLAREDEAVKAIDASPLQKRLREMKRSGSES